jgi:hypothetical protein
MWVVFLALMHPGMHNVAGTAETVGYSVAGDNITALKEVPKLGLLTEIAAQMGH